MEAAEIEANSNDSSGLKRQIKILSVTTTSVEIIKTRKEEEAFEDFKEAEKMPLCAEKCFINLIYLLNFRTNKEDSNSSDLMRKIKQELNSLHDCSRREELLLINEGLFRQVDLLVDKDDYKTATEKLEPILKEIRPLNRFQLAKYIDEAKKARDVLTDEDAIFLLGGTGVGKSTSIHFFGGSKMELKKVNGLDHIVPTPIDNQLKRFRTSPYALSETRHIQPLKIPLDKYNKLLISGDSIIIVDTPGFEDTNGAETDISNSVGIYEAVQNCKTVRIIILVSYESIGDRMTGIKNLAHHLTGMIKNIEKNIKAVSYVFTKFPVNKVQDFHRRLCDIYNNLKNEDSEDKAVSLIIKDMAEKTSEKVITLDPLKDDPETILKELFKNKKKIEKPDNVFMISISQDSQIVLKNQISAFRKTIIGACKRQDYPLAIYILDQFKILADLQQCFIEDGYEKSIQDIYNSLEKDYSSAVSTLKIFEPLSNETLQKFNASLLASNDAKELERHLNDSSPLKSFKQGHSYVTYLEREINSLIQKIELEADDGTNLLLVGMNNLLKISAEFKEFASKYDEAQKKMNRTLDKIFKNLEGLVSEDKFEEAAKEYSKIQDYLMVAAQILSIEKDTLYQKQTNIIMNNLKRPLQELLDPFRIDSIKKTDIQSIKVYLEKLKRAKLAFNSNELNIIDKIKKLQEDLIREIKDFFTSLVKDVQSLLDEKENSKSFSIIQRRFEEMKTIREIPQLESRTVEDFMRVQGALQSFVREIKLKIENFLKNGVRDKIDYDELREHLKGLKGCEWVEKCYEGAYTKTLDDVKIMILRHLKSLESELIKLDFDVDNRDNILTAHDKISKIMSMESLGEFIADLSETIERLEGWYNLKIENGCESINSQFNWEEYKNFKEGGYTWDSETYQSSQKFLKICNSVLQGNACSAKLQECQRKINSFIKNYLTTLVDAALKHIADIINTKQIDTTHSRKARLIKKSVLEIKEIQKIDFQKNSYSKALQTIQTQLEESYHSIEDNILNSKKNYQVIETNLQIANCLKILDPYLNEEVMFSDLVKKYETNVKAVETTQVSEITNEISNGNYRLVAQNIQKTKATISDETFIDIIQAKIHENILKKLDSINGLLKSFKSDLEIEKIKEIFDFVHGINEAKKYLASFLKDLNQEITNCFESMEKKFVSSLSHFLALVENSKKLNKFLEVEEKLEHLEKILESYEEVLSPEFIKQYYAFKMNYYQFLRNLSNNYKNIENLRSNEPRKICEELEKLKDRKNEYAEALKEMNGAIYHSLQDSLSKLDTIEVSTFLDNVPQTISKEFKVRVKDADNAANKLFDNIKAEISREGGLNSHALKSVMDSCRNEVHLKKFEEDLIKKMEEMQSVIESYLKAKNLVLALDVSENLFNVKNALQGRFRNFDIPYSCCKREIEKHFKNLISSMRKLFSELSGSFALVHSRTPLFVEKLKESFESMSHFAQLKSSKFLQEFAEIHQELESIHNDIGAFCSEKLKSFSKHLNENNESVFSTIVKGTRVLEEIYPIISEKLMLPLSSLEEINSNIEKKLTMYQKRVLEFDILSIPTRKMVEEQCSKLAENLVLLEELGKLKNNLNYESLLQNFQENLVKSQFKFKTIISESLQNPQEDKLLAEVNRQYNNLETVHCTLKNFASIDLSSFKQEILNGITKRCQEGLEMTINNVTKCIIELEDLAEGYLFLKQEISKRIDEFFVAYSNKNGKNAMSKVGALLIKDYEWKGVCITKAHKCFEGLSLSIFNDKTKKYGIDYVINNIRGDFIVTKKLKKRYDEFSGCFEKLVKTYLSKEKIDYEKLVASTKVLVPKQKQLHGKIDWSDSDRGNLPSLLAHIFALWTLQNSSTYFESMDSENKESYLLKPHPAQVIAIFRLLGIGEEKESLENNLVQIGTGEGKSVALATTAIVLALAGFDVHCSCYSQYLSERDFQKFQALSDCFGVTSFIHYGTFYQLCEDVMNADGNLREFIQNLVLTGNIPHRSKTSLRPKILLLDEVDIFFSKDFYGKPYNISVPLKDQSIFELATYIWRNRHLKYIEVLQSQEYQSCLGRFKDWKFLIQNAVIDMLLDIQRIDEEIYDLQNENIRYKDLDNMLSNVRHGYKTLFCYFKEFDNQKISKPVLEANSFINVNGGSYSYAEIPKKFNHIMGITGTLETLGESEKKIIKDYQIKRLTYMPSVFGKTNLKTLEIFIENRLDYHNKIRREIDNQLPGTKAEGRRAVLVFFATLEELMRFKDSEAFQDFTAGDVQVLTEEMDSLEKESAIKKAGVSGRVTLVTRPFGRGTDFGCIDPRVSENGGIHVIQTFFADSYSEEFQIKGRTARQGEEGTYRMILLEEELERFEMTKDELEEKNDKRLYDSLNKKRNALFESQYQTNTQFISHFQRQHIETEDFFKSLLNGDLEKAKQCLELKNKGKNQAPHSFTLVLMDATCSMEKSIYKTKLAIGIMFERIKAILAAHGVEEDCFMIQIAVYRNYNVKAEKLLQTSSWESSPDNLRAFLDSITVAGGWGNEAIEVGLWHANQEAEKIDLSQIILIGDAAPNTPDEVQEKRNLLNNSLGDAYWHTTKFADATTTEEQIDKLKSKKIPIHAYYVNCKAKAAFKSIAHSAEGECNFLDINSSKGAEDLTRCVSVEVLKNVGRASGHGDKLSQAYDNLYC